MARKSSPTFLHSPTAHYLSHTRWEAHRSNRRLFHHLMTRHSAQHPHQEDKVQLWTKPPAVQHTSQWLLEQVSLQPVQSHITKLSYVCIISAQKDVTQTTKNWVTYGNSPGMQVNKGMEFMYLTLCQARWGVPLVEFMYLAFTGMPNESCRRWLGASVVFVWRLSSTN